jgi:CubicO group peptidase (beta-lactamase class C family)
MSHDQLGHISNDMSFGIGFGVDGGKVPLKELGSEGAFGWGGFFYTTFSIDPKEQMIVIFMGQLHPTGDLTLDREVHTLAYQAIND